MQERDGGPGHPRWRGTNSRRRTSKGGGAVQIVPLRVREVKAIQVCSVAHVIIADDDESVRILIARVFHRLLPTAEISSVGDGATALAIYDRRGADLLITDYMMPELDGAELVVALRARGATLPILMISAVQRLPLALYCDEQLRFLSKPFDIDQIEAAILAMTAPLAAMVAK
jgi:DNA-binding NtrC family response regulator